MIPNTFQELEEVKKLWIASDRNEFAYTVLIKGSGKLAFNLLNVCKNKYFANGNSRMAWER
jgi:hypothetical protein